MSLADRVGAVDSAEVKSDVPELGKLYLPFHCWSNIGKKKDFFLCGQAAGYYKVFRANANMPTTDPVYMWLCPKHKKSVEKAGYQVHPATFKSEVHGTVVTIR